MERDRGGFTQQNAIQTTCQRVPESLVCPTRWSVIVMLLVVLVTHRYITTHNHILEKYSTTTCDHGLVPYSSNVICSENILPMFCLSYSACLLGTHRQWSSVTFPLLRSCLTGKQPLRFNFLDQYLIWFQQEFCHLQSPSANSQQP